MQNLNNYKLPKKWLTKSNLIKRAIWRIIGLPILSSSIPGTGWRKLLLRIFGAKIGRGGRIKPNVKITYPWKIEIGNYCWIGEEVWIDSLEFVKIGNNVCLSQRAFICTGNHDYKSSNFDLISRGIIIDDGCWIGACSVLSPGTKMGKNSVAAIYSLIKGEIQENSIYMGNPAIFIKERKLKSD